MDKKRVYLNKINNLLEMFPVVAVLGPRQSGKSTFVKQAAPDWKYYDLESPSDYNLITNDLESFFELNKDRVIIDEAQQYPDLFKVMRVAVDSNRKKKGRYIVTGSSSPDIVKGLTESLAGRIATIEMAPFKASELYSKKLSPFYEILVTKPGDGRSLLEMKKNFSLKEFMSTWYLGGFPEPLIESSKNPLFYEQWMENYIDNYVKRDIRNLFPKLNIHNFRRFLTLLAQFSGHQLNISEMGRSLEISATTVKDYLDIIHQTFLWRNLKPFEKNQLKKVQKSDRGFFRDPGIHHFLLKIKSLDDLLLHPVAGHSFESFVTEEIIRGFNSTMVTQTEFTYYRTIDKSEVDLVIDGPFGLIPIEIKLGSSVQKKKLKGLQNFISDMNLKLGLLINNASKIEQLTENIIQVPVNFL